MIGRFACSKDSVEAQEAPQIKHGDCSDPSVNDFFSCLRGGFQGFEPQADYTIVTLTWAIRRHMASLSKNRVV